MSQQATDPLQRRLRAALVEQVRSYARDQLPPAMVPAHFVVLDRLPRLPNGKTDRKLLPSPSDVAEQFTNVEHVAPRTALEHTLCQVWQDLLGVPQVGVVSSFYDLGGTSLSLMRMAARVKDATGKRVDLRDFMGSPTIRALAHTMGDGKDTSTAAPILLNRMNATEHTLRADAILPKDVRPTERDNTAPSEPRRVLLTGGTGYTGAFLLRELIDRSTAEIVVLARAQQDCDLVERVLENLDRFGLQHPGDRLRICAIDGDVAKPYMGLSRSHYEHLAISADMIVHNAADSRWTISYTEAKPTNVLGSVEVLRLACHRRNIPVHYVGSTGSFPTQAGSPLWLEEPISSLQGVVGGYRQTKWVSDALMHEARARGLPVSVYRPGALVGAQDTGVCATDTFINHLLRGWLQLGAAMRYDFNIEMVPIDFCAAAIAHIALQGREPQTYHVLGAKTVSMNEVLDHMLSFGYGLEVLDYRGWRERLLHAAEAGSENDLVPYLPLFGEDIPGLEIGMAGSQPRFSDTNLQAALSGSGITREPLNERTMFTYLQYFIATGFMPAPQQAKLASNGDSR